MIIKKEYKIETMCEELYESIQEAYDKNNSFCEMGILFLRDILEVLEEVKEKTEEKTLVFSELENGTRTSGYYSTEEAGKALKKTIEKVNKKGLPDCYNCYDDKDLECNNCEEMEGCKIATDEREKEEAKKKSCFGNYQDCYMCTHCIDYEGCIKKLLEKQESTCDVEFDEEDICCQWCDGFCDCLKASRKNEQKKH